jgi:hypothetical protein
MSFIDIPLVYVAGPYTALSPRLVETNVRVAEEMAYAIYRSGGSVVCPHTTTRWVDGEVSYTFMCLATLAQMVRCDAVIFLPGWEKSSGSVQEHEEAQRRGMPTFYSLDDLKVWLTARGARPQGETP